MQVSGNTVLITGGASGIGLALAERFVKAGSTVIVCGRREGKLQEAKERLPGLHTRVCDVANEKERQALVEWVAEAFPNLNVLVNNAGIQQHIHLASAHEAWSRYQQEIAINLEAPIHLTLLLLPHLLRQQQPAIVNISSGLAVTPAVWAPIYSATKAGLRSFTISLRMQTEGSGLQVIEVLPPAVNTDLGGPGLHTFGAPVDAFADSVFAQLEEGRIEIGYGGTEERLNATKAEIEAAVRAMWQGFLGRNPDFQKTTKSS
ncbi:MAG: SDR family NAD(P)-dependent oxidoreductase [Alicyclobacillus macrosporangiidus]|uniref:SDR family oxidoreductase n=1 Tax=Alicyclobacillus macrosporangiidus TaxID=392015 RepID=UPI0026EEFA9F|nr:SDR family NAD(P)-dependent oxidoreductase [Alicyclobacillus macrosporangiidus]MCL6597877.1 SDR family NAD(P)-dependent oxidoreductase [Alicyclobacillus macrosporangiidus]